MTPPLERIWCGPIGEWACMCPGLQPGCRIARKQVRFRVLCACALVGISGTIYSSATSWWKSAFGHNNHARLPLLTFHSFQNDRSRPGLSECEATDKDVTAEREREDSACGNTTEFNRRWINAPRCAVPMFNERRDLTDVATGVASGCPNIGRRNGADAVQCRAIA